MFHGKIKVMVIGLISLCLGLVVASTSHAANNAAGLAVSPPLEEKIVQSGDSYSSKVKITNPTDVDLNVVISLEDFAAQGEDGGQTFIEPDENTAGYSLAKWITTEKSLLLKAAETREIPYTVAVPAAAEPGGHYGVIFFTSTPVDATKLQGSGAVVIPKIGELVLVTVPGDITYSGNIKEFSTNKTLFINSKSTVDFLTRFENLSSVHVKPQGTIKITNVLGKEAGTLTVNEKMGNVLPNSIRKFTNSWEKKYGFGMYKAAVALTYADGKSVNGNLTFWIIPWKETLAAVIILLILIWIIRHISWKKPAGPAPIATAAPTSGQPPVK